MVKNKLISALFDNRDEVEDAIGTLLAHGLTRDDIGVLMTDRTRTREFGIQAGTKTAEGLGVGSAVGGAVGAVIGAIVAIGTTLSLPGIGLVVAGPLAGALAGAGAVGAAGGLIGALIGAGIPEHRAREYERGLRQGGILLVVEARDAAEARELEAALSARGAHHVRRQPSL